MTRLSAFSTLALFGRMAIRRQLNRAFAWKFPGLSKGKADDAATARVATVHRSEKKSLMSRIIGMWLPLSMLFGLVLITTSAMFIIVEAIHLVDAENAKTLIVASEDYDKIVKAARASNEKARAAELKEVFASLFSSPAQWLAEKGQRVAQERYDRDGVAAFAAVAKDAPWSGTLALMSDAGRGQALRALGLYLAIVSLAAFGVSFGLMGKNLSSNDPSLVWLWQFPVSRPVLFLARLTENVFDTPIALVTGICYTIVATFSGASFGASLALGVLLGLTASISIGAVRLAVEIFIMQKLRRRTRGAVIATAAALGSLALLVLMVGGNSEAIVGQFTSVSASIPQWVFWNPFSGGVGTDPMLSGAGSLWWLGPPAIAVLLSIASVALAVSLTADGLGVAQDSVRDSRHATLSAPSQASRLSATAWKEWLQLRRQPEFLGQIMVAPISMMFLIYAGGYQRTIEFATGSGVNLCVAILVGGAYMLLVAANQMIKGELQSLWLLQCQPRPLADVIRSKARVWAAIAGAMCVPFVGYAIYSMPGDTLAILANLPYMAVSLWLLAELSFGFSVLSASVNNENLVRFSRVSMFLPMLLVIDVALAMNSHNLWNQLSVMILLLILNSAVRERQLFDLKWLSDPVENPPLRVYAMHGLLAVVGFQALTGGFNTALTMQDQFSPAAVRLISYSVSAAVVGLFCFIWLHNNRLSIRSTEARGPVLRPIAVGLAVSCLVGFVTVLSLKYLNVDTSLPGQINGGAAHVTAYDKWFYLVLFVVLAPLFEEWVFRGFLFRSLRRGYGVALSVALSAILFATVHPAAACVALVTLGAMTALTAEKSKRLWPAMAVHAGYNLMVWALAFAI